MISIRAATIAAAAAMFVASAAVAAPAMIAARAAPAIRASGPLMIRASGPLVIRASGPSAAAFKPGQRLGDVEALVLRAGDQLTVLDGRGTRSFNGPGNFRLDRPGTVAAPTAFAELLTQKTERRARIGAVRGVGGGASVGDGRNGDKPVPPGVWAIDAGDSGHVCALDTSRLSLWRADPAAAATVTVSRVAGGQSAAVAFAAGQAVAPWPASIKPGDDGQFHTTGAGEPATLVVHKLVPPPATIDALATAFVANGCTAQLDRLAALTRVAEATPTL